MSVWSSLLAASVAAFLALLLSDDASFLTRRSPVPVGSANAPVGSPSAPVLMTKYGPFPDSIQPILNKSELKNLRAFGVSLFNGSNFFKTPSPGLRLRPAQASMMAKASLLLAQQSEAQMAQNPGQYVDIPDSFDLRGLNVITDVRDQGSCGSCTAFASVAAMEGSYLLQTGQHTPLPNGKDRVDFSEAYQYFCATAAVSTTNCNTGAWSEDVMSAVAHFGVQNETQFPYFPPVDSCRTRSKFETHEFNMHFMREFQEVKRWIMTKGPLYTTLLLSADFQSIIYFSPDATYDSGTTPYIIGAHAVAIVGWDWNYVSPYTGLRGRWLCKNSWGKYFGNQGYFYLAVGQLGILSGMAGETIGFELKSVEETYCVRGTLRRDPFNPKVNIDLCDALRLGNLNLRDAPRALKYFDLAMSVRGRGVEPYIECTGRPDYTKIAPFEFFFNSYRGVRTFVKTDGILEPLLKTGCRLKPKAQFRLKSGDQCAVQRRERTPSWLPRSQSLVGYPIPDAALDAVYCSHRSSLFILGHSGALKFLNRRVGAFMYGNEWFLTLDNDSTVKFEIWSGRVRVVGTNNCIGKDGDFLKLISCAAATGQRRPTIVNA